MQYKEAGEGQVEYQGQFIEVVCAGVTPEAAEIGARAALGFVGLCFGDNSVGERVFSESYLCRTAVDAKAVAASHWHYVPTYVGERETNAFRHGLSIVETAIARETAIAVALHWYEQALYGVDALDRVIAYFISIEAVIKDYARKTRLRSSLAPLRDDRDFKRLVRRYMDRAGKKALKDLVSSLVEPRNMERFEAFSVAHNLPAVDQVTFVRLSRLRSKGVHGAVLAPTEDDALDARELARTVLKASLGINQELMTDRHPGRDHVGVRWSESEGWIASPKVDWEKRLKMTFGRSSEGDEHDESQ